MDLNKLAVTLCEPIQRVQTLYKVVNKKGKAVPFRLNIVQQKIISSKKRRRIILKARQMGVSTLELIRMLDYVQFMENKTACIIAHEQDAIKKLFRIVKSAYTLQNHLLRSELDRGGGSMYEMRFPSQNSKIYVDLESRGDTIHWLHISEAAFIKDFAKVVATMQAVPIDGIVTVESTANGIGNWFYDTWFDDGTQFEKHFYPWFMFKEYEMETKILEFTDEEREFRKNCLDRFGITINHRQMAFRRAKQSELKYLFRQEYPEDDASCFLSSGRSAMDLFFLSQLLTKSKLTPTIQDDGYLKIWKRKDNHGRYACGADTSEGVSGDYCVASMFDRRTMEQVAVLRGRWKPFEFANKLDEFMRMYERPGGIFPQLAVERNNHGHAVLLQLHEHLNYPNLYVHTDEKLGWLTDRISRPVMLDTFIDGVETNTVRLLDPTTIQECLTLVEEDGKIQAETGKHDDCVIASAIAVQLCVKMGQVDMYDNIGKMILF